ncbi:MAG: sarcosine oxidase subunit beta [Candidatus Poriferisodalaceae bacterium]|jgi:sarcosine oxidase subunit beta
MPQQPGPICVIGAGIIGASAAFHLVEYGARDVIVIDAGEPLSGTTPAGAGFIARFGADHNRRLGACTIPLQDYATTFYSGLHESGADLEFAHNGNLVLARTQTTLDTLVDGILRHPQVAPGTRLLDADGVAELMLGSVDPAAVVGGVYMPEGIQLTTALAQQEIIARLEDAGVQFHWETQATGVRVIDGAVTGVETNEGTIDAATIVFAAGTWTQTLLASVDRRLPLIPMVATRFVSEPAGLSPLMPTVQCLDLGLWLRELHGAFSWGGGFAYRLLSALEEDGLEFGYGRPVSSVLLDAQYAHQENVAEVFPALSGLSAVETIQGVPVYTADGGLYVGAVPDIDGLWALAGDNESGITHAPGMGKLIAQLIMDETPFTDPTPFRLDRVDPAAYPDEPSMVAAMAGDRIARVARAAGTS